MKNIAISLIRFYQRLLPVRKAISRNVFHTDRSCRFSPTCSDYAVNALQKYGARQGLMMSLRRFMRCHPWSVGGYDPLR